ncbi:hypothetical protein BGW80DRAFT_241617 [Lactifluus volemus]|nr:hypothetical protein BGW80DRAFT_241617 [Lactifluus volemus]
MLKGKYRIRDAPASCPVRIPRRSDSRRFQGRPQLSRGRSGQRIVLPPSGTVEPPERALCAVADVTGASMMKDESVAAADNSACAARLEMLSAAVRKLFMLFECRDCGSELMLEIDRGRALSLNVVGSRWRIRMRDNLRVITLTSGSRNY